MYSGMNEVQSLRTLTHTSNKCQVSFPKPPVCASTVTSSHCTIPQQTTATDTTRKLSIPPWRGIARVISFCALAAPRNGIQKSVPLEGQIHIYCHQQYKQKCMHWLENFKCRLNANDPCFSLGSWSLVISQGLFMQPAKSQHKKKNCAPPISNKKFLEGILASSNFLCW